MLNLPCNKYECYMYRCYVIYNISIDGINWLWLLSIFASLKTLGSLQYKGGAAECFFSHQI